MGRIVVTEFVTADGVVEAPGGDEGGFPRGGWSFRVKRGEEGDRFKLDELRAADAMLLGRATYDGFARAWPTINDGVGFAALMNGLPKFVISKTLQNPTWNNTTVLPGDLGTEVKKLKATVDRDILVHGSPQLVQGLTALGLVDEYHLMLFPVILGAGKRLFGDMPEARSLELVSARPVGPDGVVILTYRPQA
jgi:dihydrofolate reductase